MKEGIHIHNYEAWLLDRLEGRLTPEEEKELESFLREYPECGSPLQEEDLWALERDVLTYPGKEGLYKHLPHAHTQLAEHNFDLFSIARLEGDLSPAQVEEHEKMLSDREHLAKEWQEWQRTRLHVEEISYKDKHKLQRRKPVIRRLAWLPLAAAAAVAALVFILLRSTPDAVLPLSSLELEDQQDIREQVSEQVQERASLEEAVPETGQKSVAKQAAGLRILKHQDPPERTENYQENAGSSTGVDSVRGEARAQLIRPRPLRMASLDIYPGHEADPGYADEIHTLALPVFTARDAPKRLRDASRDFFRERDISVLTLAHTGIQGFNRLTGSELSLDLARSEEGDVSGFSYQGQRLSVAAPVGKPD